MLAQPGSAATPEIPDPNVLSRAHVTAPVRALFFAPSLGAGGAEMQILRLLQHLDRRRVTPSLCVARGGGSYESRLPADVTAHAGSRGIRSSIASVSASIPSLRRRIQSDEPDVVLSLLEHSSLALWAATLTSTKRPKLVLGIQNNFGRSLDSAPALARKVLRPLYLQAYQHADHVIALSQGVARDLTERLPGVSDRTSVVYNAGTDERVERLAQAAPSEPRPVGALLVACGRLDRQKDYPTLLRAFARLESQPAPTLWVVGEGPLRAELQAQCRQLGVAERVRWLGFRENPYALMAAADAFVLSSQWEGFANVVVEALACGTPVVATDCDFGPGEILASGQYGRLVPVADVAALATALSEALAEGKSPALSDRCKRRARDFSAPRSAEGYAHALERVVAHR